MLRATVAQVNAIQKNTARMTGNPLVALSGVMAYHPATLVGSLNYPLQSQCGSSLFHGQLCNSATWGLQTEEYFTQSDKFS